MGTDVITLYILPFEESIKFKINLAKEKGYIDGKNENY